MNETNTTDITPEVEISEINHGSVHLDPITEVSKKENTITFKRTHIYASLLPLAFVIGLSVGYIFWGKNDDIPSAQAQLPQTGESNGSGADQAAQGQSQQYQRYDIQADDDPSIGAEGAPITIIEFSDYECPYCRKWHLEVLPQLWQAYSDKVRLVFRDFPLSSIHSNAVSAAVAANCAGEQGSYWEFNERLFSMELNLGKNAYQQYASELNLDMQSFDECIKSNRFNAEIQADYEYAANLGVRSTPTFFVNGIPLVGAQPFEVFQQLIDMELAGEIP